MHRYLYDYQDFLLIDEDPGARLVTMGLHGPKWKRDPEDFDDADEHRKDFDSDDYDDYNDEDDYSDYEDKYDRN